MITWFETVYSTWGYEGGGDEVLCRTLDISKAEAVRKEFADTDYKLRGRFSCGDGEDGCAVYIRQVTAKIVDNEIVYTETTIK